MIGKSFANPPRLAGHHSEKLLGHPIDQILGDVQIRHAQQFYQD
jgi:hypothetical protein